MSIRKNKRRVVSMMYWIVIRGRYERMICEAFRATPEELAAQQAAMEKLGNALLQSLAMAVETPRTYTVARKKDGEVVGTFDTVEEANEVIAKAKAGKKATLVLV